MLTPLSSSSSRLIWVRKPYLNAPRVMNAENSGADSPRVAASALTVPTE